MTLSKNNQIENEPGQTPKVFGSSHRKSALMHSSQSCSQRGSPPFEYSNGGLPLTQARCNGKARP